MRGLRNKSLRSGRILVFSLTAAALLSGMAYVSSVNVSANHPVLVEGNCDSPAPGTTLVTVAGTCGDFDGDGRIGTAEDTDGADRIFGTLNAALGPGTGAAAGTGANMNGTITIVASGRFAETLFIGQAGYFPGLGSQSPGNVTIEAAPGVNAQIDAVFQGDPAGGSTSRQAQTGIFVLYPSSAMTVTLRNLTISNFLEGVAVWVNGRVIIDRCRIEHNKDYGVKARDASQVVITNSTISSNGYRIPVSAPSTPGHGVAADGGGTAQVRIFNSTISHNFGAGVFAQAPAAITLYQVATYFNSPDISGPVTIAPNPNHSQ
jgi:Right handed beta helix region